MSLENGFIITEKYIQNLSSNQVWDIFPVVYQVDGSVHEENVIDPGKIAVVNLNVSFNYLAKDYNPFVLGVTGTEVIKVLITSKNFISGDDETDVNKILSCPLIVTSKNCFSSSESFGNQQNFFFKVFLKEGQKITILLKKFDANVYSANNLSIRCAGRITDEINYE